MMRTALASFSLRHLLVHRLLVVIAVSGLALGVGMVVAVRLINRATLDAFSALVDGMAGKAGLQVTRDYGTLPEDLVETVAGVGGIERAIPLVQGTVFTDDASAGALTVLGIDVTDDEAVRTYEMSSQEVVSDSLVFLSQPNSVIVTAAYAERHGLSMDAPLTIIAPTGQATMRVRGILSPTGIGRLFGGDVLLMDIQAAQRLLDRSRRVDEIDVVIRPGVAVEEVAARLKSAIPPDLRVGTPRQRGERLERVIGAFQALVSGLGALVLIVGAFAAYATVATTVIARRNDLALLRLAGAGRSHLRRLLVGEAIAVGIVASALGIVLGWIVGEALRGPIAQSATLALRVAVNPAPLKLVKGDVMVGVAIGLLAAILATVLAARDVLGVTPLEALLGARAAEMPKPTGRATRAGFALASVAVILLILVPPGTWVGNGAAFLLNVAIVVLARPAVLAVARALGSHVPIHRAPVIGLAARGLETAAPRAATAVGILVLGLAVMVTTPTVEASLVASLHQLLRGILRADIVVSSAIMGSGRLPEPIDAEVGTELRSLPGVADVETFSMVDVEFRGTRIALNVLSPQFFAPDRYGRLLPNHGPEVAERVGAGEAVFASTNLANHLGIRTGDEIVIPAPDGPLHLRIAGIVNDYFDDQGALVMVSTLFARHWPDRLVNEFHVRLTEGTDVQGFRTAVGTRLSRRYRIRTLTLGALLEFHAAQIGRAFAFMHWIELLVLFVTFVSLAEFQLGTLHRRTHEIGILRAGGAQLGFVRRMLLVEGLLLGVLAAALGLTAGVLLSVVWVRTGFPQLLGFMLDFHFAWAAVIPTVSAAVMVSLGAALLPAARASRVLAARIVSAE